MNVFRKRVTPSVDEIIVLVLLCIIPLTLLGIGILTFAKLLLAFAPVAAEAFVYLVQAGVGG